MHEPLPRRVAAVVTHDLHRDFETRSAANLAKVGAHKYAADPSTEVLCAAYAVNNGPVKQWWPGDPVPPEWIEAEHDPSWSLVAHNDAFETAIEQHILGPRHGFAIIPIERHRCTMAMALVRALPAKLGLLADVLELANRKDAEGGKLMRQMSKPLSPGARDDPAKLVRLGQYNVKDVKVEREAHDSMLSLSPTEQALWVLNCRINARGFHFDRAFAEAARAIVRAAGPEINAELAQITNGVVSKVTQVARIQKWLHQQGYTPKQLNRKTIEKLISDDALPASVRHVLELRLAGAHAAANKLDALFTCADADDRVRGTFRHHGAATGRASGERFQPQNMKRSTVEDLDAAIAAVATGDYAHVKSLYPQPLAIVGSCIRPTIDAAPGHELIGGDFSSVESRVLAWLADEKWKLANYLKFDVTQDPRDEPYCETACKIFQVPSGTFTNTSPERKVGKTGDLSFGYQGGLNAFRKFSDQFTDAEVETFKHGWRAAHPATVKFWYDIDNAAVRAIRERGKVIRCGRIELNHTGAFLQLLLPSGRNISYPRPRIIVDDRGNYRVSFSDNAGGKFTDCRFGQGAFGGTWTENVVSGIARDLLTEAMLRIEAAGYPIVLHVHDEIVCEVPIGFGSGQEFTDLMTRTPYWAEGLPIAAAAWSGSRYVK